MKLFIKIAYLGTNYCGYQVQPNGVSVQQRLNEATRALFGFDCDIVGCSRTDSGVHANEFCAVVTQKGTDELKTHLDAEKIPLALTAHLPWDISVFEAKWVESDFHPRYDVKQKEYLYRFYNHPIGNPFEEGRAYHVPKPISDEGLARMQEAASTLCGRHDFSSYMAQGSKITDPVRTVAYADVTREGNVVVFRIAADGFLYNMVRILAGTLLMVGQGKLDPKEVKKITEARDRRQAGPTLSPCGLYLNRVFYD